jgi:hypothetical protein
MVVRQAGIIQGLLQFDLRSVPPNAHIETAILGLYALERSNDASLNAEVFALSRPWVSEEATWLQASDRWLWHAPGAGGYGRDRSRQPAAVVSLDRVNKRYQFDVTEVVQGWVDTPWTNQGFVIRGVGGASVEYRLASSDWHNPTVRPWLYLYYRRVTPTPGPSPTPRPATATPPPKPTQAATATLRPTQTPSPTLSPTPTLAVFPVGYQRGVGDYDGVQDTHVNGWLAEENFGEDRLLVVRSGGVIGTLLRFDLSGEDPREGVARAILSLYVHERSNDNPMRLNIHEIRRDWDEYGATWLTAKEQDQWARPGASGVPRDHEAALVAAKNLRSVQTWYHFDVTQSVRKWVQKPWTSRGFLLQGYANVSVEYRLASSEWAKVGLRPKLTVFYALEPLPDIGLGEYID